jgi:hypothetical protein
MKMVMEASLNDYIEQIKKILPEQPNETEDHISVSFICENDMFTRRFNKANMIEVNFVFIKDLKNYMKVKLRTYSDIQLTNLTSNKNLSVNRTLDEEGFAKEETLAVKLVN